MAASPRSPYTDVRNLRSRILTQGHGIVLPIEHVTETLKDRLEPLALPRPCRQAQVAHNSWSGGALIRNRGRYRQ